VKYGVWGRGHDQPKHMSMAFDFLIFSGPILKHEPKVFSLLSCIQDLLSRQRRLEFGSTRAYFSKYLRIILSLDDCKSLSNKTSSKKMYNTRNYE
jgi:hypothetical protein